MHSFRDALRQLWRNLGFTLTAVLTLGIGIGLVTTQFSLIDGTLIRPLPFADGERLYHVVLEGGGNGQDWQRIPFDQFQAVAEQQRSFDGLAAYVSETYNLVPGRGAPVRLLGAAVSANFFTLLRVIPLLGRVLDPGSDQAGQPLQAVIAYRLWRDAFGADPQVIGQAVRLNGEVATIVAVMPEAFAFPGRESVWVNLRAAVAGALPPPDVEALALLKPAVTVAAATQDLNLLLGHYRQSVGTPEDAQSPLRVARIQTDSNGGSTGTILYSMLAMTAMVLLLGCINVAGLLSVRASERVRDLALRTALGARRRHVLWSMLSESLLLAAFGALLGLLLARLGVGLLQSQVRTRVDMLDWMYFDLNPRVLLFAIVMAVLAGVLAGLLPALRALRVDPGIALRGEGRGSVGRRAQRSGRWLMVGQTAFACTAMLMAALFALSALRSSQVNLAFDPDSLLIGRIELQGLPYVDVQARTRFYNTLVERVQQTPGVLAVAASSRDLVDRGVWSNLEIAGASYPRDEDKPGAYLEVVTRDYFAVVDRQPLSGRVFGPEDREDSAPVAVVNQSFAARFWPGGDPIGQRIRRSEADAAWATVIGVVPDLAMRGVANTGRDDGCYLLQDQQGWGWLELLVRTRGNPTALIDPVRAAVAAVDPDQPVHSIATLRTRTERRVAALQVVGSMTAVFAAAALLLAAIGTYGVMAYSARLRTRELGLRVALGASRVDLILLMLRQNLLRSALGVGCGLALGLAMAQPLAPALPEVSIAEIWVYVAVGSVLLAAALLACWLPAWRSARVDPMVSLRAD